MKNIYISVVPQKAVSLDYKGINSTELWNINNDESQGIQQFVKTITESY